MVGGRRRRRCDLAAQPGRGCDDGICPFAAAACGHKMATLDGRVRGRGDPFFSLTLSLSNPTTWMEMKRNGGRDSSFMADRRRGVGAVAARRRGFVGGSARSDMHSLERESRTGESLAFGLATATPAGAVFPLGHCCIFFPLLVGSSGENHILS
uniref:Uncharacterized protein n=1 Tax=Oryza glumipatula TaxID=40148 RepID=A0A0E0A6I5_9ORYZ